MYSFHKTKMDSRCVHASNGNLDKQRDIILLFDVNAANNTRATEFGIHAESPHT